jgi:hypothetical protein
MKPQMNPIGFFGGNKRFPIIYQDDKICLIAGGDGENGVISIYPMKAPNVVAVVACYEDSKILIMATDSNIDLALAAGKPAVLISR